MFEWLRESTWGYPIIGALHVLGMAWFGGAVLIVDRQLRAWKRVGMVVMFASGMLLFALQPAGQQLSPFVHAVCIPAGWQRATHVPG